MAPEEEDRILRLAVERGWLSEHQVARAGEDVSRDTLTDRGRWGARIELFVRRGLLDEGAVQALAREAGGDGERVTGAVSITPGDDFDAEVPGLADWDRYRVERLLGAGGSGRVYLAHDPRLGRRVAIKFLSRTGEHGLDEARAQARVEHPGVCKVYEVGKLHARPYIAMQLVEGETLRAAAGKLGREGIARVLRAVAEAVHAAHRIGVVHRDLKPANILVERGEQGELTPYVVDFGLAREMGSVGSTVTGSVLGTPSYMAPEQARGEVRRLDRRTDVYGLGATLYDALTGAPPFRGEGAPVLLKVIHDEPVPPRRIDPSIPADLETITLKCLEKDPARRYDSALALAEDLDRWLRGAPVRARAAGVLGRIARWSARHRALSVIALAALAAVGALGAGWARSRAEARREAELARRLGEEAKEMESLTRLSHLSPLHDTRPDKARVLARIEAIDRLVAGRGGAVRAAGEYAAGRGLLAIGRHDDARARLAAAAELGDRGAAPALAEALAAIYERRLEEARRITDPAARAARVAELRRELRDPARAHLAGARAAAAGTSAAMIEAMIHFLDGQSEEALARARAAAGETAWLHDARKLEGDIHRHIGGEAQDRGDYAAALASFAAASSAYAEARAIGRSDAAAHEADCTVRVWALEVQAESQKAEVRDDRFEEAVRACDEALAADPDRPGAAEQKSAVLQIQAGYAIVHGADPRAILARAVEAADRAVAADPGRAFAHATRCLALRQRAEHEASAGADPRGSLAEAIAACERAVQIEPGLTMAHNALGVTHRARAEQDQRRGVDPRPSFLAAAAAYQRAASLDPTFAGAWNNIGRAHALAAEYELDHGVDPRPAIDRAVDALKRAVEKLPDNAVPHASLGTALLLRARYELREGRDPRPAIAPAEEAFARSLAVGSGSPVAWKGRGDARRVAAEHAARAGLDPRPDVAAAIAAYEEALRVNPKHAGARRGVALARLVEARLLDARGEDGRPTIALAREALDRVPVVPDDLDTAVARAELELGAARADVRRRVSPDAALRRGLDAAAEALRLDARDARAVSVMLAIEALRAAPR